METFLFVGCMRSANEQAQIHRASISALMITTVSNVESGLFDLLTAIADKNNAAAPFTSNSR